MLNNHFSEEKDKTRFETFVDAILAIIITILVLEFKVPEEPFANDADLKTYIIHLFPSLFAYLVSFITIVALWMDHHYLFRNIKKANSIFILLNLLFILFLSATPFTTALAGRNYRSSDAVALVATNYSLMILSFQLIWWYAMHKKILPEEFNQNKSTQRDKHISFVTFFLQFTTIPLAYINTYIPFAIFIVIMVVHIVKHLNR